MSSRNKLSYDTDKSGKECLYRLGGLEYLFRYLRTLDSNKILDIGVGTGRGTREISKMGMSEGLIFEVTSLRLIPALEKNFPKNYIHITSIETLRDIPDKSMGAVIGANSVGYSADSNMAVKRIDEVLIPGGVFKASFASTQFHNHDLEEFRELLNALHYDLASAKNDFYALKNRKYELIPDTILLAIKSPGDIKTKIPSAKELLALDLENIRLQAQEQKEGIPCFEIKDK